MTVVRRQVLAQIRQIEKAIDVAKQMIRPAACRCCPSSDITPAKQSTQTHYLTYHGPEFFNRIGR
jgi:hypothetical protein